VSREGKIKMVVYTCSVVVVALLASKMALCHRISRIIWNPANGTPGMLARFYFLVILGLIVIVTQNIFIRRALARIEKTGDPHVNESS